MAAIDVIPTDCLELICHFLRCDDILNLSMCNKRLYFEVAQDRWYALPASLLTGKQFQEINMMQSTKIGSNVSFSWKYLSINYYTIVRQLERYVQKKLNQFMGMKSRDKHSIKMAYKSVFLNLNPVFNALIVDYVLWNYSKLLKYEIENDILKMTFQNLRVHKSPEVLQSQYSNYYTFYLEDNNFYQDLADSSLYSMLCPIFEDRKEDYFEPVLWCIEHKTFVPDDKESVLTDYGYETYIEYIGIAINWIEIIQNELINSHISNRNTNHDEMDLHLDVSQFAVVVSGDECSLNEIQGLIYMTSHTIDSYLASHGYKDWFNRHNMKMATINDDYDESRYFENILKGYLKSKDEILTHNSIDNNSGNKGDDNMVNKKAEHQDDGEEIEDVDDDEQFEPTKKKQRVIGPL